MNANSKLQRSPNASYEVVAGEAIVINLKTGVYYSLNEVGTAFWNLLDGARTVADCAQQIAELISEDRPPLAVIVADLIEVGEKLAQEKLVKEL